MHADARPECNNYDWRKQVRGVIFDSAPGDRHMIGLYRAISAIYGKQKPLNFIVSWMITWCLLIVWFFEDTYEYIKYLFCPSDDSRQPANPFRNLKDEENCWPQMFLYSKQDMLIRYTVSKTQF